jgi:hypothetical protein
MIRIFSAATGSWTLSTPVDERLATRDESQHLAFLQTFQEESHGSAPVD